jgi:hypothetical protein
VASYFYPRKVVIERLLCKLSDLPSNRLVKV